MNGNRGNPYNHRVERPPNPYKRIQSNPYKKVVIKGIRKKSYNTNWYLTNKNTKKLNYSINFNGPVPDGDKLILLRPIKHNRRVTWGENETIFFEPPEQYNPWDNIHRMDSLIKILKPRKF